MTILTSTNDIIRVVTGSAVSTIEVQASYVDLSSGTYAPGSTETEITTATTTTVIAAPGASTYRRVKNITVRNNSTTASSQVTVQKFNGTIAADLMGVTLLPGETLTRDDDGNWRHYSIVGAKYLYSSPNRARLGISGAKAETLPRMLCTEVNSNVLTSGTLHLTGLWLAAGTVVNSISWFSASTAAVTPTNQFFALYSRRWSLLAQSANNTTTAWAANSIKTLSMTSAYTIPVSDIYYVGIMVAATTVPTLKAVTSGNTMAAFIQPLRGNSTSGLTTALPNPAAAVSGSTNSVWACVS